MPRDKVEDRLLLILLTVWDWNFYQKSIAQLFSLLCSISSINISFCYEVYSKTVFNKGRWRHARTSELRRHRHRIRCKWWWIWVYVFVIEASEQALKWRFPTAPKSNKLNQNRSKFTAVVTVSFHCIVIVLLVHLTVRQTPDLRKESHRPSAAITHNLTRLPKISDSDIRYLMS